MMTDEWSEDSVEIKSDLPMDSPRFCSHCQKRQGSQASTVQTTAAQTDPESPDVLKSGADVVLVPRDQLAMLQKYYMAVKDVYYNYALTDGDSKEVVRKLFEQTPEVLCAVNQHGQSPIESALSQGRWAAGAQLLDLAGRRNSRALGHRTASGQDALMLAVSCGSEATVRQLVALGCGRGACFHYNSRGQNSLHLSALGSSSCVLEILLAELSELLAKGQLTPECAVAALTTNDCDGCSPLHYMARENQVQMLRAVLEFAQGSALNLDWDSRQATGHTPLAMAAETDALGACEFLLQRGLAGIDLAEQRDMWMAARLSDSVRALLAQHCPLLGPMSALCQGNLDRLQAGLHERGLADEFLLKLRTRIPTLPQLTSVGPLLTVCQNFCGSSRLVVWDILTDLGTGELARLLEA